MLRGAKRCVGCGRAIDKINAAFERVVKADVKYRFVIDMSTLSKS